MTVVESLENMQGALYNRLLLSKRNTESLQRSIILVDSFISDYLKWSGEYAGAKQN